MAQEKEDVVKDNLALKDHSQRLDKEVKQEIGDFEEYKRRVRDLGNEFRQPRL